MADSRDRRPASPPPTGRFIGAVFGFVFFGIGVTVLILLWGAPFGEFKSPPIFFRIFGSFIALAFVAMGGTLCVASITGRGGLGSRRGLRGGYSSDGATSRPALDAAARSDYHCPHCGAPLADGANVSPHGDARCSYCKGSGGARFHVRLPKVQSAADPHESRRGVLPPLSAMRRPGGEPVGAAAGDSAGLCQGALDEGAAP